MPGDLFRIASWGYANDRFGLMDYGLDFNLFITEYTPFPEIMRDVYYRKPA
ncbi:hypothetical protein D3C77_805670 [compost metagenome]